MTINATLVNLYHVCKREMNYLEAYHLEVGLLINFGAKSLAYKRLTNKKHFAYTSFH